MLALGPTICGKPEADLEEGTVLNPPPPPLTMQEKVRPCRPEKI